MNKTIWIGAIIVSFIVGTITVGSLVEAEQEKQKFENVKAVIIELKDDAEGNSLGWNPDGFTTTFSLYEAEIPFMAGPIPMSISFFEPLGSLTQSQCYAPVKTFDKREQPVGVISCETAPPEGTSLKLVLWVSE